MLMEPYLPSRTEDFIMLSLKCNRKYLILVSVYLKQGRVHCARLLKSPDRVCGSVPARRVDPGGRR